MKFRKAILIAALSLAVLFAMGGAAAQDRAEAEIQGLIEAVQVSGCEFERNGKRYDSLEAADHMRLKYRRGKRYAKTVEQFIDRLASKSSISGRPYVIICADSGEHTAKQWLEIELAAQRSSH